jgi:hypothetical protein
MGWTAHDDRVYERTRSGTEPDTDSERLTSMSLSPQASARSRWLLPVVAAAVVAAVLVAVLVVVSAVHGRNGATAPPVLHLAGITAGSVDQPIQPAAGASDKSGPPRSITNGAGWRLEGTLPNGSSSGRVHRLPGGTTTGAFVTVLARALGMKGEPKHLSGGWYFLSGTTELSVSELAGRHWTYSNHGCIAGPVLDPQTGTACAVAQSAPPIPPAAGANGAPGGTGFSPPPTASPPVPVPENIARSLARPVFEAVGVNPEAARVDTVGGQRSIVFSPQMAGLTVVGLETRVSVDQQGEIVDASGWLATPTASAMYPLISARQAFDQLRQQPQPMMALGMPCRSISGRPGCGPTPHRVVTGATLGLTQAYSSNRGILLVPAWLFQVRGEPTPVAVVAVEAAFLGEPEQPSPKGKPTAGNQPGSIGGGGGANDGTQNTVAPIQVAPADPSSTPAKTPR